MAINRFTRVKEGREKGGGGEKEDKKVRRRRRRRRTGGRKDQGIARYARDHRGHC